MRHKGKCDRRKNMERDISICNDLKTEREPQRGREREREKESERERRIVRDGEIKI